MLREEFNVQIARLEAWFDKQYTEKQKDHIFDHSKVLTNLNFSKVVDKMQRLGGLPKAHKVLFECENTRLFFEAEQEAKVFNFKIKCEKCQDFGYQFGKETVTGYEPIVLRCECLQADWWKAQLLPVLGSNLTSGIVPAKFDMSWFKPSGLRTQILITKEWQELLNTSLKFWEQRKGE